MAVRVSKDHGIISQDLVAKTVVARLFADAKEDITDDMTVIDLPEGYTLDTESYVITAAGDIGILDSTGTWNWVGDEEEGTRTLSLAKPAVTLERQSVEPISEPLEAERREEPAEEIEEEQTEEPAEDDMR